MGGHINPKYYNIFISVNKNVIGTVLRNELRWMDFSQIPKILFLLRCIFRRNKIGCKETHGNQVGQFQTM